MLGKVEICGVNTANLPTLSQEETGTGSEIVRETGSLAEAVYKEKTEGTPASGFKGYRDTAAYREIAAERARSGCSR